MRRICLLLVGSVLIFAPAHAGHSPPKVFLRIYVQSSGEGMSDTQVTHIALPPNGETIMIRALPEVTERELIGAQPDASGAVHLQFNHQGQVVISAFTAQNQNRIMVVMLDGYIQYAPVIDEQITNGEIILPHPLRPEALKLLQQTAQQNVTEHNRT